MRKLLTALVAAGCVHAVPVAAQVAGVRSFTGACGAGQPVEVQLDVDVGAQVPNGVIVVEKLPDGWVLNSATPPASSFNTITGEARWVFFGGSVNDDDLDIHYSAGGGDLAAAVFSGDLRYNNPEGEAQTVAIGGQTACASRCVGDCNADGAVTIDEIVQLVTLALGSGPMPECRGGLNGEVTVDVIVTAVNHALAGCF